MLSAYKKRKREEKIGKLSNDSSHWSGLEHNELEEDLNSFISKVRKLYYKGNKKSFKQFMSDIEDWQMNSPRLIVGVMGVFKNANFPNLQRTKSEKKFFRIKKSPLLKKLIKGHLLFDSR